MPEPQPWRNPRPTPDLHEMRGRLQPSGAVRWLSAWWPALAWAGVIFSLSTDTFSSEHTAWVIEPILKWMVRSLTNDQLEAIHHLIRKGAHFTEYFIFCLLLYRGVRLGRAGWRWTWGVAALSCAAVYSVLDEIHQAFVSSRTASAYDSLLDSIGAFAAFGVLWLWFHLRRPTVDEVPVSSTPSV